MTINLFHKVKKLIRAFSQARSTFRIEEIDTKSKKVVISRRGMQTILKISLIDAVRDSSLICNLSSDQACWLGYYYGKSSGHFVLEGSNQSDHFSLEANKGKYKILSQDRRGGIHYYNLYDQTSHNKSPLDLINDKKLINGFDPSQACYIGILAGLLTPKQVEVLTSKRACKPNLRLVN